jgi:two-component system, chemotaxis family, protein-glutamate methylesterase/glutaminase
MPSLLPEIVSKAGALPAAHPSDGEPIAPGRIDVARPDHHLLLEQGRVRVTRGPKENHFRPALDPLFRSAALSYGLRVVGVLLFVGLDDRTYGPGPSRHVAGKPSSRVRKRPKSMLGLRSRANPRLTR